MPRPPKSRTIRGAPRVTRFKPSGIPARQLETVVLGLDELEALRLADLEGLYQEEAAARMSISRPTFGRLVAQARRKVADALFHGKALVFAGGAVILPSQLQCECRECGKRWEAPDTMDREACAGCGSSRVDREDAIPPAGRQGPNERGRGRGRRRGRGYGHGRGGRGRGQGWGRRRGGGGAAFYPGDAGVSPAALAPSPVDEKTALEQQKEMLEEQLASIGKQLESLQEESNPQEDGHLQEENQDS